MATRILMALLAALALLGGGYRWGASATDNAWAAKAAKDQQAATAALQKETARADAAAGKYLREHLDQEDRYAALDDSYRGLRARVPLVVRVAHRTPVAASEGDAARVEGEPFEQPAVGSVDVAPVLTFAAVRMWNGALTGTDAPAGACDPAGAAEGADAACAAASGLTLDDAWRNHAVNAKSCAQDRQRYQHLIDFLNRKRTD